MWKGKGINSKGYIGSRCIIRCSKRYFRPSEVDTLLGNYSKAKKILNWKPKINITKLVDEMVKEENKIISNN